MATKRKKAKAKPKRVKYRNLFGCYVVNDFRRTYTRKYLQALVGIRYYKGRMLLSVDSPSRFANLPEAWCDGNDLDALIAILREAKSEWLKAHKAAERLLIRQGSLPRLPRRKTPKVPAGWLGPR